MRKARRCRSPRATPSTRSTDRRHRSGSAGQEVHRGLLHSAGSREIEKRVRQDYPDGIPAVAPMRCASPSPLSPTYSRTINFDLKRVEGYRNFCNKLWNAARFVAHGSADLPRVAAPIPELSIADRWIRARFGRRLDEVQSRACQLSLRLCGEPRSTSSPGTNSAPGISSLRNHYCRAEACSRRTKCGTRADACRSARSAAARATSVHAVHHRRDLAEDRTLAGRSGATIMLEPYPDARRLSRRPMAES